MSPRFLLLIYSFAVLNLGCCWVCGLKDVSIEDHPYVVSVHDESGVCAGILITKEFVLTDARCFEGEHEVNVTLGCSEQFINMCEKNVATQIIFSNELIFHDDFFYNEDQVSIYNILLIKLSKPAEMTKSVQTAKLHKKEDWTSFKDGNVGVIGWQAPKDGNLKEETLQLIDQDKCEYLFKNKFIKRHNVFAKKLTLNLVGNPVVSRGNVLGIITFSTFKRDDSDCVNFPAILLFPFIEWIKEHTEESIFSKKTMTSVESLQKLLRSEIEGISESITQTIRLDKEVIKNQTLLALAEIREHKEQILQEVKADFSYVNKTLQKSIEELRHEINDLKSTNQALVEQLNESSILTPPAC